MRLRSTILLALALLLAQPAVAADRIRLAIQKTGTVAWEMAVIRAMGLDRKADIDLAIVELASTDAGKIAISGGAADIIVSDWLWVARERSLGGKLALRPYSTAVGAVMTAKDAPIHKIADLVGRKIGIAGGPLDKSWLLLQAQALRAGIDLKKQAQPVYGAAPLIAEKLAQGEIEAALQFWNFCVDLESRGMRRAIEIRDIEHQLGASGAPVVTGYVFDEDWAARNRPLLQRFFAMTDEAKRLIAASDEAWAIVAPMTAAKDASALTLYRQRYAEGIPTVTPAEQEGDARTLFAVLANIGGEQLVGPARDLPAGVFWKPAP